MKEALSDKEHKFRRTVRIKKIMLRWLEVMAEMSNKRKCWTNLTNQQLQQIKGNRDKLY